MARSAAGRPPAPARDALALIQHHPSSGPGGAWRSPRGRHVTLFHPGPGPSSRRRGDGSSAGSRRRIRDCRHVHDCVRLIGWKIRTTMALSTCAAGAHGTCSCGRSVGPTLAELVPTTSAGESTSSSARPVDEALGRPRLSLPGLPIPASRCGRWKPHSDTAIPASLAHQFAAQEGFPPTADPKASRGASTCGPRIVRLQLSLGLGRTATCSYARRPAAGVAR